MMYFCPFCNSIEIDFIGEENMWYCKHCGESFDKSKTIPSLKINYKILEKIINKVPFCFEVYLKEDRYDDSEYNEVYERDNYICQLCNVENSLNTRLLVHHVIPLPYGDSKKENLILLCSKCHRFVHQLLRLKGYGKDKGYTSNIDIRKELEKKGAVLFGHLTDEEKEICLIKARDRMSEEEITESIRQELEHKEGQIELYRDRK